MNILKELSERIPDGFSVVSLTSDENDNDLWTVMLVNDENVDNPLLELARGLDRTYISPVTFWIEQASSSGNHWTLTLRVKE